MTSLESDHNILLQLPLLRRGSELKLAMTSSSHAQVALILEHEKEEGILNSQQTDDTFVNGNGNGKEAAETDSMKHRNGKKGKLGGLFHKKSKDEKEEAEDNNGKQKHHFTVMSQIRATLFNSWINILLIASPIGIALHFALPDQPIAIFVVNFIAIIPLAALLSYATEEIALRTGEVIGGLLNASFGNAVELIVVSFLAKLKQKRFLPVSSDPCQLTFPNSRSSLS